MHPCTEQHDLSALLHIVQWPALRNTEMAFSLINPYKPFCGTSANSAKPDQTPQNAASDQVLHCLQTDFSIKI